MAVKGEVSQRNIDSLSKELNPTVEQPLSLRSPWTRMNEPHTTGSWGRQYGAIETALDLGIFDLLLNSGAAS